MNFPKLTGLADVADDYDLFIFDLWGVIHDGVRIYPDALTCLRQLRQREARIVLLSNAARLSDSIAVHLEKLGVAQDLYDLLLTSGDATVKAVTERFGERGDKADPSRVISPSSCQPAYYHLGPERTRSTLSACGGREVALERAELIMCTGLINDEKEQIEEYADLLKSGVDLGLPMICANPDIVVKRGEKSIPCAGALAALYETMGGKVECFGKPFPYIFDVVFSRCPDIARTRAVMIGDSLHTDIRGARLSGIDAIWIGGGIHAEALGLKPDGELERERGQRIAEEAGENPRAMLPRLRW